MRIGAHTVSYILWGFYMGPQICWGLHRKVPGFGAWRFPRQGPAGERGGERRAEKVVFLGRTGPYVKFGLLIHA
jgi:hypothetical protein